MDTRKSLNSDDYVAAEKTFQLLTQAAGRAGRGKLAGEVVIQTYNPDHYAITTASMQDYEAFYEEEIGYRKMLRYPPVGHLLLIMMQSDQETQVENLAVTIMKLLETNISFKEDRVSLMGPADARIKKVQDIYRKAIYVKAFEYQKLVDIKNMIEQYRGEDGYKDGMVSFDFDPIYGF